MHEIYLALFAHHPRWAKRLLILRGWLVAPFGLKATTAADLDNIEIKPTYAVGEKIARFTLYGQSDTEIITGGDDRHLDFRVSVQKMTVRGASWVVLSTVVSPHNFLGQDVPVRHPALSPAGRQDDPVECDRSRTTIAPLTARCP